MMVAAWFVTIALRRIASQFGWWASARSGSGGGFRGGGFHGAAIGVAWRGAAVGRRGDCGWNPGWRDGGGWGAASNLLLRTFRFQADQRSDRDDFPRRPACGSLAPSTS
jgi:hypothetical protein